MALSYPDPLRVVHFFMKLSAIALMNNICPACLNSILVDLNQYVFKQETLMSHINTLKTHAYMKREIGYMCETHKNVYIEDINITILKWCYMPTIHIYKGERLDVVLHSNSSHTGNNATIPISIDENGRFHITLSPQDIIMSFVDWPFFMDGLSEILSRCLYKCQTAQSVEDSVRIKLIKSARSLWVDAVHQLSMANRPTRRAFALKMREQTKMFSINNSFEDIQEAILPLLKEAPRID
jgi:hypothetical protein